MTKKYSTIAGISFINSDAASKDEFVHLYDMGFFNSLDGNSRKLSNEIGNLGSSINSRLRNRMSRMSLGIYHALENGPAQTIGENEELCLFTGFGEIDTTDVILKNILVEKLPHVSPTLFHNSVHHTALGYYTIIKGLHNPCLTISDGLATNCSFIHYISKRVMIDESLVIAFGDEYSDFFRLDKNIKLELFPSYGAYRIIPGTKTGFRYHGEFDTLEEISKSEVFENASTIISDAATFTLLKGKTEKNLMTDYPAFRDAPCSLAFRLAFPFYFDIKGSTIVLQKNGSVFFCFEVML